VLTMFVVHTVNQLEEAVRVGAGEILVTGGLASNIYEAYLLKTSRVVPEAEFDDSMEPKKGKDNDVKSASRRSGVAGWGLSSLTLIAGEYALLDSRMVTQDPYMLLQRAVQH